MATTKRVELTDIIGKYGPFQRTAFIFASAISVFGAYQTFILTVVAPSNMDHWCARTEPYRNSSREEWKAMAVPLVTVDGEERYSRCELHDLNGRDTNATLKCGKWEYDNELYGNTIVEAWNLVCSNAWLISLSQSVFMAGCMLSIIIFGQMADRMGRRMVICTALAIHIASGFAALFSNSFISFMVIRFFISFGGSGVGSTSFILLMEMIGPSLRSPLGLAFEFGWAIGYLLLAVVAFFVRDWFYIHLVAVVGPSFLGIAYWVLPESPRWLLASRQFDKARDVIMDAVQRNDLNREEAEKKLQVLLAEVEKEPQSKGDGKATLLDLVRRPILRMWTLILFGCWFVASLTYYATSLNTSDLGGDLYVNFAISAAVEFPAYALSIFVISKTGRKASQSGSMVLAGIACALSVPLPEDGSWSKLTLLMLAKFLITASYGILYVYSAEIYPTVVRNVGVGACSIIALVAAVVAPFLKELGIATHKTVPIALCSAFCIFSGLSALLLPETAGRHLPDTLQEGEFFTACQVASSGEPQAKG